MQTPYIKHCTLDLEIPPWKPDEFSEWFSLLVTWSLYALYVIWLSVLAVLSEAGSCVNCGRPSQTTGKNQHEALTTTQRSPDSLRDSNNSVFLLYTSVLKGCLEWRLRLNVHTKQLSNLVSLGVMMTPNYNVVLSRQRSFWKETFTEKCHRFLMNIMDRKQLCYRWFRNDILVGNKSCLQNWIFTIF